MWHSPGLPPGQLLAALLALALGFAIEMGPVGQAAGETVARGIAIVARPLLELLGVDLVRHGVELRAPLAGWAVRVSEVCDGMGLVVALLAAIVVLVPGQGGSIGWGLKRALIGLVAIQLFNLARVVFLALALGRGGAAFGVLHDQVFPLFTVFVIAAVLIPPARLAGFAGLAAILTLLWAPLAEPVSALLVPLANGMLEWTAQAEVGRIGETQGVWSVGTMLVAGTDPLRLYRAPLEPQHFTVALPVIVAAAGLMRRPGLLVLALPLMMAALCVAAPVAVMALAADKAPVLVLLPDGDGAFHAAEYVVPETLRGVLRLVQNTLVHFLLLVLPVLALHRARGAS